MTWRATFAGHAADADAESQIVAAFERLWDEVKQHCEGEPAGNLYTTHHGNGPIDQVVSPTAAGTEAAAPVGEAGTPDTTEAGTTEATTGGATTEAGTPGTDVAPEGTGQQAT